MGSNSKQTVDKLWHKLANTTAQLMLVLGALSALLCLVAQIQSANAHSLMDNSIHGHGGAGGQHQISNGGGNSINGNQRQHKSGKLMMHQGMGKQNRCQTGWIWFNNKCWVATQSRRDHEHAMELCSRQYNSTLPTIYSEEENEFLRQNLDLHNSPIWLHAKHNHQYNKTTWMDSKTTANYTRWDVGQPSDKSSLVCIKTEDSWYMRKAEPTNGQTECVSFWEDAKWGTQVGCLVLLPVVCEKKLVPLSRLTDQSSSSSSASGGTLAPPMDPQFGAVSGAGSPLNGGNIMASWAYYLIISAFTITTLLTTQTSMSQKQGTNPVASFVCARDR